MVRWCSILSLIVMDITSLRKLTGLNLMLAVLVFSDRAAPPAGLSCIYRINPGPVTLSSEVLNLNRCLKVSDGYWTVKEESSLAFVISVACSWCCSGKRPGAFIVAEKGIDLPARRYAGCALTMNEQQYFGG